MTYLPAFCDPCGRAILVAQAAVGSTRCAKCGAPLRVVPGASYREEDLPLFAEVEEIVHGAALGGVEATLMAADLENVAFRSEAPELTLERLGERIPGLATFRIPRSQSQRRIAPVIGILLTIVAARRRGLQPSDPRPASSPHNVSADVFSAVYVKAGHGPKDPTAR